MDFKVKCVGYVEPVKERYFTVGKVYDVVNGVITRDDGFEYHTWSDPKCNPKYENSFKGLTEWFKHWYKFELVTKHNFKVGDMVIGNDPDRYAYTNKGWIGEVKKVHSDGCIDVYGKRGTCSDSMTFTFLEPQYFDLYTPKSEKIVITHDGKTTTATLYREDGSKEVATAKCSPEDTFDFNFGAKLAMERLMGKTTEPKKPEPPKYYNGRVIRIHSGCDWWTKGKIYTFVNGVTIDNDGDEHWKNDPIKDINRLSHLFLPIVE